jgi:putative oxidoreductase
MNKTASSRLLWALDWLCRLVVAAVFLLAAVPKLLDHQSFAKAIINYRVALPLIGQNYVYAVAVFLPALEAVGAIALLFNRWKRAGALVCGSLLMLFIVLIAQAVLRGLNIDCGCFGAGAVSRTMGQSVGIEKILEDVLWLAGCAVVWLKKRMRDKG